MLKKDKSDEEVLMEKVLEAGAEDMKTEDDIYEIVTELENFETIKSELENASIPMQYAEITMVPQNTVKVDEDKALKVLKLMDVIEEHEDVQNVYSNFDISDDVMQSLQGQL